ncbi:hypothetical protein PGT21_017573 [Puccinia graminis f. sp. tritici]|uniref:Uncharacterized protein n=1 Tax=Puccinia graminis f. sp. tritici TaxID=56615 RepID=A0A5B0QG75_PUCGR|nr:hypothetical protein PGT21_017573 [Puccinia graminis f. sp. tritici]
MTGFDDRGSNPSCSIGPNDCKDSIHGGLIMIALGLWKNVGRENGQRSERMKKRPDHRSPRMSVTNIHTYK